jgi:hypothetical protein
MATVRKGAVPLRMFNSGLEVWLYDEAHLERLRASRFLDFRRKASEGQFEKLTRDGLIVGYSLLQDDELQVEVVVGKPLTKAELRKGRWLEPRHAWLRLPSGKLCVESNDALRVGLDKPTERGGKVSVPPGDYRVTLYRADFDALEKEGLSFKGPQEVIVLTAGGTPADAASDLLPFEPRRDTSGAGRYTITDDRLEGLAWFDDELSTFWVNLDSAAVSRLGIVVGTCLKITVPEAALTLLCVYASSSQEGRRLPLPSGVALEEYGVAVLCPMEELNRAEILLCMRERARRSVKARHRKLWLPATVEVMKVAPARPDAKAMARSIVPSARRVYVPAELRAKDYFEPDFLPFILSEVFGKAVAREELPLAKAVDIADKAMKKIGLTARGDFSYEFEDAAGAVEHTSRVYTGLPDTFAFIITMKGDIEVVFGSESKVGRWVITGLTDGIGTQLHRSGNESRVRLQGMSEALGKMLAAHKKALAQERGVRPAPKDFASAVAAYERFMAAAFD